MSVAALPGSFWPTSQQRLLLRVVLAADEEAAETWSRLRPSFDIERLEPGSFALMPLLYRRLNEIAPTDPLLGKLRGIYRRTWYTNSLELTAVTPALATLVELGIDPLVINGWELAVRYYGDLGARAVQGLHVLVSPVRMADAVAALAEQGWKHELAAPLSLPRRDFSVRFSRDGAGCVVHRQLFHEFLVPPRASAPLDPWECAVDVTVGEVRTRMLAPADEFLNICLSGARARGWPNTRWPADAASVARTAASEIDWQRVLEQARHLRATLRLRDSLTFLRAVAPVPIPADVFAALEASRGNRRESLAHVMSGRRGGKIGLAPESIARYLRLSADRSVARAAAGFPSFLRDEWGLRHVTLVPVVVTAKAASRILRPLVQAARAAQASFNGGRRSMPARR